MDEQKNNAVTLALDQLKVHLKFWRKHTKSIFMYANVCLHWFLF